MRLTGRRRPKSSGRDNMPGFSAVLTSSILTIHYSDPRGDHILIYPLPPPWANTAPAAAALPPTDAGDRMTAGSPAQPEPRNNIAGQAAHAHVELRPWRADIALSPPGTHHRIKKYFHPLLDFGRLKPSCTTTVEQCSLSSLAPLDIFKIAAPVLTQSI